MRVCARMCVHIRYVFYLSEKHIHIYIYMYVRMHGCRQGPTLIIDLAAVTAAAAVAVIVSRMLTECCVILKSNVYI